MLSLYTYDIKHDINSIKLIYIYNTNNAMF